LASSASSRDEIFTSQIDVSNLSENSMRSFVKPPFAVPHWLKASEVLIPFCAKEDMAKPTIRAIVQSFLNDFSLFNFFMFNIILVTRNT
jgi:hypothetical protein